jgi:hypothetical protein
VVRLGKAGTFGLMCAFPLFLAGSSTVGWHHIATVLAWFAAIPGLVLAWASLAVYAPKARDALANRRGGAGESSGGSAGEPAAKPTGGPPAGGAGGPPAGGAGGPVAGPAGGTASGSAGSPPARA